MASETAKTGIQIGVAASRVSAMLGCLSYSPSVDEPWETKLQVPWLYTIERMALVNAVTQLHYFRAVTREKDSAGIGSELDACRERRSRGIYAGRPR